MCPPGATSDTITTDCWQLVIDINKCPRTGWQPNVLRTAAEIDQRGPLPAGSKVVFQCWACPADTSVPGCDY